MTKHPPRKLLAATLGLATLSLVGCTTTSGNLVAPDSGPEPDVTEQNDGGEEQDSGESGSKE
jgi:hypothetical protein